MENIDDLYRDDLLYLINCYNDYVMNFFDEHDDSMRPVSVYEFYSNEFQEIVENSNYHI